MNLYFLRLYQLCPSYAVGARMRRNGDAQGWAGTKTAPAFSAFPIPVGHMPLRGMDAGVANKL